MTFHTSTSLTATKDTKPIAIVSTIDTSIGITISVPNNTIF